MAANRNLKISSFGSGFRVPHNPHLATIGGKLIECRLCIQMNCLGTAAHKIIVSKVKSKSKNFAKFI